MNCRHCNEVLTRTFLDLGFSPPSNNYLTHEQLSQPETQFPLRLFVCNKCWLVQTEDYSRANELFREDYAYFSSISRTWLRHAEEYSLEIRERLRLGAESFVIEIASNDGYLLRNFVAAKIPCLGIEPTESTAVVAEAQGIPVLREFFGKKLALHLAQTGRKADLIVGNNVYAHVPDINDFTAGMQTALKPDGTITLEFPHLKNLLERVQFDTVYHEHFSYLSLQTTSAIFESAGLRIFDVRELSTHGGSLRIFGCHVNDRRETTSAVAQVLEAERRAGLSSLETYMNFQRKADSTKNALLGFLIEQAQAGKKVAAYGAAAKGNTFLNYAGIKSDLIRYVCDAAPSKHGKFMPGSHIPILDPVFLHDDKPDYVVILPWNIANEVTQQLAAIRSWHGKFVVAVPSMSIIE